MSDSLLLQNLSLNSPSRPPQPTSRLTRPMARQEDSLYTTVAGGKVSLHQLVSDWLEEYKTNKDHAMVSLVQFFISACGCSGQVTLEMMENMEQCEMINMLAEQFDKETPGVAGNYPVAGQGAAAKKLRGNLSEFILHLVKQAQNSILYDQYLMDNLVSLLTMLSASQVRPFRHTSTLSSMSLMTAFVHVWVTVSKVQQNMRQYLEREEDRTSNQRELDKMEKLATRLEEMEENQEEIQKMLTYMFKSVFVHRYRDMVDDIRCVCLTELGVWMIECPVLFMEDSYLKYLGWPLHDKVGSVRLCAVKSLLPLYGCREMKDKLVLFTEKFKERLVSLVLDKDLEVSVCAIQLLQALAKYQPNSLTDNHCEMVYELVYSTHRTVARAAGSFLQQRLFMPNLAVEKVRTKRGKMRLSNTPLLRDLVQFFIESDRPGYEAYLVDSLIDNPMVKDWECMTDLLVEECGPGEVDLDDSQETALIMLMVASMKQVVMGEYPPGRSPATGKRVQTAKDIRQMAMEKEVLTNHFMAILPSLIHKYLPDQVKVSKLLTIPQFMDLEMFTTSRQERALDGLLKLLTEVVEKHTEEQVLGEAFKMLDLFCCPQLASYGKCNAKREQLVEIVVMQFKMRLEEFTSILTEDVEPEDDEIFTYELSLLKLRLLCKHHDLGEREVWELLLDILRRGVDSNQQDASGWESEEAIMSVLLSCFYSLLWDKKADRRRDLRSKVDRFIMLCREVVVHAPASRLAEEAFISICDLLVVFGVDEELVRPSAVLVEELVRYLEEEVFSDLERRKMEVQDDEDARVEKLLSKRNILTCFCKLVVMKVIPAKYFTMVLANYMSFFHEFGDIIKAALGELRDSSRTMCARVIIMALVETFDKIEGEVRAEQLKEMKELARRLAMLLGLDMQKNRQAAVEIHREGIQIALGQERDRVKLLLVITEFSGKVMKQDRQRVVEYFNREVSKGRVGELEEVVTYRNSLLGLQRVVTGEED